MKTILKSNNFFFYLHINKKNKKKTNFPKQLNKYWYLRKIARKLKKEKKCRNILRILRKKLTKEK